MAKRQRTKPGSQDHASIRKARNGPSGGVSTPVVISVPAGRFSSPAGPSPEAVAAFEDGVKALQRHAFSQAAECFRALLKTVASDAGLRDRTEVYLALCERELRRQPPAPRTIEERLTAATAALNNGDDHAAELLARAVLGENPDQDLALYLLAVVEARRGATNAALHLLAQAIDARPDVRAQARHDADFEALRQLDAFQQLIEPPQGNQAGSRRPRRLR